jgi:CelD/BcsL family acetyltransferase involved in cellulose biosynthesis
MQVVLAHDLCDLAAWWPGGNQVGEVRCYAFQCAEILDVWSASIGAARNIDALFVAILDAQKRPLLLLPLGIERRHGFRILTFLNAGAFAYNAPIVLSAATNWDAGAVDRLWQRLKEALPRFDVAHFDRMPACIGDFPNPLLLLDKPRIRGSGRAMTLSGTWEAFSTQRLPYTTNSRRQRRLLQRKGSLTFEVAATIQQREAFVETMMRQKARWSLEALGTNIFDRPGFRQYFRQLAQRFGSSSPVRIFALKLNDQIISAACGFVAGSRFHPYMISYEAGDVWRYSPGRLLTESLIQWSFAHGLKIFDFGIGDDEYKYKYCDIEIPLYHSMIPVTPKGHVYAFLFAANRTFKDSKFRAFIRSLLK